MDDTFALDGGKDAANWQRKHAKQENGMRERSVKPVVRTSAGLRDALFDALDALRNGEIEPQEAKATAVVANQIVNTVQLEMDVHKMRREYPSDAKIILPVPLELGAVPKIEKK